ncbi:hypothetical protein AVEN_113294-1, partial [Araneus ventricosus]
HFQLRRCVWGKVLCNKDPQESHDYKSSFSGKLRSAVNFCPLLQELIIHVHQKDGYETLRFLKQLTLLKIDFRECEGEFVPDFFALLQKVGPQLKHLCVISKRPLPVDDICESCAHLQNLQIIGSTFVKNSSEASKNLLLKTLKLCALYEEEDKESLLFLLSNCQHLEELFLHYFQSFDDALLNQIFERNPLTELKVSCIVYCGLTREGYEMFIKKACSIEKVLIVSFEEEYVYDKNSLFKDPNLRYLKDVNVRWKEFFSKRLNKNRF